MVCYFKRYNGFFWETTSLMELGQVLHLGHNGKLCSRAQEPQNVTVLHTNGYHRVRMTFCQCIGSNGDPIEERISLLRARLYPATVQSPRTAATLSVLELYSKLCFQGKTSRYDFYHTLLRLTDNMELLGLNVRKSPHCYNNLITIKQKRYDEFVRMARQYDHLKLLLYAGRGLSDSTIEETQEGELAVECPACPHVNVNIPSDWLTKKDKYVK